MKVCSMCRAMKHSDSFGKDKSRKDGKNIRCKECVRIYSIPLRKRHNERRTAYNKKYRSENREQYNAWERRYHAENREHLNDKTKNWRMTHKGTFRLMHLSAQRRAKEKGLLYELTPEIIHAFTEIQNNKCALTGVSFDYGATEYRNRPFAPSVDRRDNSKGYTVYNIQIVTCMANKAKNEFTQEMFDQMCINRVRVLNGG